jgi:hypothetical protein
MNWEKKNVWRKSGKDFMVEVFHATVNIPENRYFDGKNRWCVYAYIYPKHRLFSTFHGDDHWQDATQNLPLHCGCTYLDYMMRKGEISCIKVGADYSHLYDDKFAHYDSEDAASTVFSDAEELFDYLSKVELPPLPEEQ